MNVACVSRSANCDAPPACDETAACHAAELPQGPNFKWHVQDDCQTARLACNGEATSAHSQVAVCEQEPSVGVFGAPGGEPFWNIPVHGATACAIATSAGTGGTDPADAGGGGADCPDGTVRMFGQCVHE